MKMTSFFKPAAALFLLSIIGFAGEAALSEKKPAAVLLYELQRRSGIVYEWRLDEHTAERLPKWDPEVTQKPPLDLTEALRIARTDGSKNDKLESISLLSIPGAKHQPPFQNLFYYLCVFEVDPFDSRASVVLMNKELLKPATKR